MSVRFLPVLAAVLIGITSLLFSDLSPHVKTASQQQTRSVKDKRWDREPIKVVAIKVNGGRKLELGQGQLDDDDWLRDLTISIKNTSSKNIVFVELELHFLRPPGSDDNAVAAFPIIFGTPPLLLEQASPTLGPQQDWQVSLSAKQYAALGELLAKSGYMTSIKDVEIITREVVFTDKTKWVAGRMLDSTAGLSNRVSPPDLGANIKKN